MLMIILGGWKRQIRGVEDYRLIHRSDDIDEVVDQSNYYGVSLVDEVRVSNNIIVCPLDSDNRQTVLRKETTISI